MCIRDRKRAVEYAWEAYGNKVLGSGEGIWSHALGMSVVIAGLKMDAESRIAALLFAIPAQEEHGISRIEEHFGKAAAHLVNGISRLNKLRPITEMCIRDRRCCLPVAARHAGALVGCGFAAPGFGLAN